jgi:hypothetical protein
MTYMVTAKCRPRCYGSLPEKAFPWREKGQGRGAESLDHFARIGLPRSSPELAIDYNNCVGVATNSFQIHR